MKRSLCLFFLTFLCLHAAEISVDGGIFKAKLNTRGGALTELQFRGKLLSQARPSMTDRMVANHQNGSVREAHVEFFRNLEYRLLSQKTVGANTDIVFQVRGIGAFNWLRMTKTYHFVKNSSRIKIDYRFDNLDTKPHYAGIWTQTFLRYCGNGVSPEQNTIWQPRENRIHRINHPGKGISMDEWGMNPGHAWLAVGNTETQMGVAVLLPQNCINNYYSFFDLQKGLSTLEWMLRQQKIAPGKSFDFTVELNMSNRLTSLVKSLEKRKTAAVPSGDKLWITDLYRGNDKTIKVSQTPCILAQSEKYMNVNVLRQYHDSIRSVRLPGNVDPALISVCEIQNGHADPSLPVPFHVRKMENGEYQVLFAVPGFNDRGESWNKIDKNGDVYGIGNNRYLGKQDYTVQIALDRAPVKKYDPALFRGGADMLYNGDFSKKASYGDWPDGFYWGWVFRNRKWYQFENGVMRVTRPDKSWPSLWFSIRTKGGEKLTLQCRLRNDDRANGLARIIIDFYDKNGKLIPKTSRPVYQSKTSHDWRKIEYPFYVPAGAVRAVPKFQLFGIKDQFIYIDDIKVIPDDLRYQPKSKLEQLRDQTKNLWYKPLDRIEQISHAVETPHKQWLKPSAFAAPEILFLPFLKAEMESLKRRTIVELFQRMDLTYQYIPLLSKILNIPHGSLGVYGSECAPELEAYTIEKLKQIKKTPQVIIIQGLDFKNNVKAPFLNWFAGMQKKGVAVLFINCRNIPETLLGRKIATPAGIRLLPQMRNFSETQWSKFISFYENDKSRNVVMFYSGDNYYTPAVYSPSALPQQLQDRYPAYYSREFPYWEFTWLPMMKAIRWLAHKSVDVEFLTCSPTADAVKFQVRANGVQNANLEITYTDLHRHILKKTVHPVSLKTGVNVCKIKHPRLQGGTLIAEYRLLTPEKKVLDAGASKLVLPEISPLKIVFKSPEKVYRQGENITFAVQAVKPLAGHVLRLSVEDSENRIVYKQICKIAQNNTFKIALKAPFTKLYRVLAEQVAPDGVVSAQYGEFTLSGKKFDTTDLTAMVWHGQPEFMKPLKDLGYDLSVCPFHHFKTVSKNHINLNLETLAIGASVENTAAIYRGDKKTDPVRNPCYSDPARTEKVRTLFRNQAQDAQWQYYSLAHYFLGDEMFLGSTVCYSPHCLKNFRDVLKKQYKTLDALNKEWETAFAAWDDVIPCQLEDLKDSRNLSRWLDHKMFMAGVFAYRNVGEIRKQLNDIVPDVRCGISGTQLPGYSYDWAQLMKHINFIAYYSGVQIKLVHDFGGPDLLSGRWGCGYVDSSIRRDQYQNAVLWQDLFQGANMAANYATGSTFQGDLSHNSNIEVFSSVVRELKRGLSKLVLTSRTAGQNVAVLYSQPSLFAAMATIGKSEWLNAYSAWNALLEELHINYRFISYEDLTNGIDGKQFKVLILPCALALSPEQTRNLERFVQNGGTVIADFMPGCFDEHGKRFANKNLADLFGIPSTDTPFQLAGKKLTVPANPAAGISAVTGDFRIGSVAHPVMNVKKHGKGKAILMNLLVNGYQTFALSGVGGEVAKQASGSEIFCRNIRQLVGGMLAKAGVDARCRVTLSNGVAYPCQTMLRNIDGNYVFGIMKYTEDGNTFDMRAGADVTVTLPVKGHIYNVREKKYLGNGNTIKMKLVPAWGYLYTVLKNKIVRIDVDVPTKIVRGSTLTAKISAVAESGTPGALTYHVELIKPDGQTAVVYQKNLAVPNGTGVYSVQTAFNDPAGKWRIRVTNVNTGIVTETPFELQ